MFWDNEDKRRMIMNKNNVLNFKEMMVVFKEQPRPEPLWRGITKKSFGLVFGPSKSGKTIICENFAMSLACGKKQFFGYNLDGIPKKILFLGLEEFWVNRADRNKKQYHALDKEEQQLIEENYLYQGINYKKRIITGDDWKDLNRTIVESKAEIVFIDSITRLNHGKLEDSDTAETIMQNLREICYKNGITLICIHHTPKMKNKEITMDCIKGSAVFSQESDFAIGINRTTKGNRYLKNVFYRYASDDIEKVSEFSLNENIWSDYHGEVYESEILERTDRRKINNKETEILSYFQKNPDTTFKTSDLVYEFEQRFEIKERMAKNYLKTLSEKGKIDGNNHGKYKYIMQ